MSRTRTAAAAGIIATALTAAAHAGIVTDYNLFVKGNYTTTSEVDGKSLIGGSVFGPAANFAIKLTPAIDYINTDTLIIGGNLNLTNTQLNAGNLLISGSVNGNVNFNGGGSQTTSPSALAIAQAAAAQVDQTSAFLASLSATHSITIPNGQPGPVNINAGPGISVFNISGSQLLNNTFVQQIGLNMNGADSVIINVSGTNINYTNGNQVGEFTQAFAQSHVLWNFFEAETLNLGAFQFNGAVLAPFAAVQFDGGINGSVAVESLDAKGEVRHPVYEGFIPAPGAASLAMVAAASIAPRRRRASR